MVSVLTCLPPLRGLLPLEGEYPSSQQHPIKTFELSRLLGKLLAALVGHHIDMPDLDIGLVRRGGLCFDKLLDSRAIPDVGEDESLDTEIGNLLSSSGAKRTVRARDQDRLALEGFGWSSELRVLLFAKHLPWEHLCQ